MPKKPGYDKKTGARNIAAGANSPRRDSVKLQKKPLSISDLLSRRANLRQLTSVLPAQAAWLEWLRATLPQEFAPHLSSAVPKGSELVVFADSAAWCARLRYALAALEPQVRARDGAITRLSVRVMMQSARARAR